MPVNRAEISEVQGFENITLLEKYRFDAKFNLLGITLCIRSQQAYCPKKMPDLVSDPVISFRCCDIKKVFLHRTCIGINSNIIIIKYNQQVCFFNTGIIKAFISQSTRQGTISYYRYHLAVGLIFMI